MVRACWRDSALGGDPQPTHRAGMARSLQAPSLPASFPVSEGWGGTGEVCTLAPLQWTLVLAPGWGRRDSVLGAQAQADTLSLGDDIEPVPTGGPAVADHVRPHHERLSHRDRCPPAERRRASAVLQRQQLHDLHEGGGQQVRGACVPPARAAEPALSRGGDSAKPPSLQPEGLR